MTILNIKSKKQLIEATDFWESELNTLGYFFVSFNAGAARILVPDKYSWMLDEMRTGKHAVMKSNADPETGKASYEIIFENFSGTPFRLHLEDVQSGSWVYQSEPVLVIDIPLFVYQNSCNEPLLALCMQTKLICGGCLPNLMKVISQPNMQEE